MEKEFFLLLASAFGAGAAASFTATRFMSSAHVATLKQQLEGAKDESRRSITERDGLRAELKGAKDDLAKLEERRQIADQRATILSEEASSLKATVANRESRLLDLERQFLRAEADAKNAMPADRVKLLEELQAKNQRFEELRSALLGAEEELWKLRGQEPPVSLAAAIRNSRVKVLTVANLKGGVGKTTITINLAAHFAVMMNLRILVIDFDYQGSLTATALNAAKFQLGSAIHADRALEGDKNGQWMVENPRDLSKILPNVRLITCGPTFDRFENQTMMRWLIGDIADDVRYRLARLITSPEVQEGYDLVIVDAPPRTSLGAVNALFASHCLIVPTVPDSLSVDAVGRFLERMSKLRHFAPGLGTVLVVPSLTQETFLRKDEIEALDEARLHLSRWSGKAFVTNAFIRHMPTLAKGAGREIGYLEDKKFIRPAFDDLGREIAGCLDLKEKV